MPERRDALVRRRKAVGLSQQAFAELLGVDVTSVRHWEAGRHPPLPHVRPAMAKHLQIGLDDLDQLLDGVTETTTGPPSAGPAEIGFDILKTKLTSRLYQAPSAPDLAEQPGSVPVLALADGTPIPIGLNNSGHELDTLLLSPLGQWAALDNRLGPMRLRRLVSDHFGVIEAFLDEARGADFEHLTYIAARHAEFAGWLAQDAGDVQAAMRWSDAALECARLIGDRQLEAYVLMRQSNIATDLGQTSLAIALADAAWHSSMPLAGSLKALALRQRAHALTADRNTVAALRSIDQARDQLTGPETTPTDLTGYCTLAYLDMESAACLVDLGQASDAIPILEQGLHSWSPEFRRDLGLGLARLGLAYARIREPETAATIATQSAQIARATGSQRTVRVLEQVATALTQLGCHGRAGDLRAAFTQSSTHA